MSDRFADLRKIPNDPALRLLALHNARITSKLASPAAAPVPVVLAELEAMGRDGIADMLRLLSVALPPRECIWWGCLAAGDLVKSGAPPPPPLAAARAWVFAPGDDTRDAARTALDGADADDDTSLIATAVTMCDGKLGTGEMAAHDAPPGAMATSVFVLNIMSLARATPDTYDAWGAMLVDRALDIARGGNGQEVRLQLDEPEAAS